MDSTEMQRKYIAHFISGTETLSEAEACEYVDYLRGDPDAPYRDRRIAQLERYLSNLERARSADQAAEEAWMAKAREIIAIKERWEALGATWTNKHDCGVGITTWEYHGETILRFMTGTTLDEHLAQVREADTKFISEEVA